MRIHSALLPLVYVAVVAMLAPSIAAQTTTTGIRGIVRDPNRAVVPNVTVEVTDNSTGVQQTTVFSSDGNFLFPNLQFGTYRLTAAAAGFKTAVIASVVVESGRTTDVSIDLEVGTTSETVQVMTSPDQINTTTNEVGATISNRLVQNLPFAGREGLNFAGLVAANLRSNNQIVPNNSRAP